MKTSLRDRAAAWRDIFSGRPPFRWADGRIENAWCPRCRLCCGPQAPGDEPWPMALLPRQMASGNPADDFHMLDGRTACLDRRGCKAHTDRGCRLDRERRPVTCGLFPLVILDGEICFYAVCPAVLLSTVDDLLVMAETAAEELPRMFTPEELRMLSVSLPPEDRGKFIFFGLRLS